MAALEPGVEAPAFTLNDVDGRARALSEVGAGELLLLVFYHQACPTSRLAVPFVGVMSRALQSEHTRIWGISQDPEEESRAFARDSGLAMPVLLDEPPYRVSEAYGLTNVPTLFLIDDGHKLVKTCVGFSKEDFTDFAAALARGAGVAPPDLFGGHPNLPALRPG